MSIASDESSLSRAGVRIAADFLLRWSVAALERHQRDLLEAIVFACLAAENLRHQAEANSSLQPLTVKQIAASLQQPYETVRRRFIALHAQGSIRRTKDGYVACLLENSDSEEDARDQLRQVRRLVRELAAVGIRA